MSREIKFRAWDGKYIVASSYGDWISFDGIPYTEAGRKYNTPNIEIEKSKDYVLMQYTGLKDKNDVDIYEGDIIKMGEDKNNWFSPRIVEFKNGSWVGDGIRIFTNQDKYDYVGDSNQDNWEIIGNIHQNPDLCKPTT